MLCAKCNEDLKFSYQTEDFSMTVYHCEKCEKWYELKKEKAKINGAVPITFSEMNSAPERTQQA